MLDNQTLDVVRKVLTNLSHSVYRRHECACQGDGVILALSAVEAMQGGMPPLETVLLYDQALADTLRDGEREVCSRA